jgi:predicted Zn-dependent peptidase
VLNGSTRFDFTNYFEIVPAHKLETMLWAEADRMRGLAITQDNLTNQQGVVKNEVKVNVLNQPYGGFPWLDLPQAAFTNWHNAHNFYGDLAELDAATLEDVRAFFARYYAPNNAALVITGEFDPRQALGWVERYFGEIPAAELPPAADLSEPRQQEERRASRRDPLANRPAFAFGYQMPARDTPAYYAMIVLDQILLQGDDSLLRQALVQRAGITGEVTGGINWPLGNAYNYDGPMLWSGFLFHDAKVSEADVKRELDAVIEQVRSAPLAPALLDRAMVKLRSDFYDTLGGLFGFGRADLLACFALFDDDPGRINTLEERLRTVTPELLHATAQEILRPTNRTIYVIEPGAAPPAPEEA